MRGQYNKPLTWSWGDGQTSLGITDPGGAGYGDWESYAYALDGTYTVTVTVTFTDGTSESSSRSVSVPSSPPSNCLPLTITAGNGGWVSYNVLGCGTCTSSSSGFVNPGAPVTLQLVSEYQSLTANPDPGYAFSHWAPSGSIWGTVTCALTVCGSPTYPINTKSSEVAVWVYGKGGMEASFLPVTTTSVVCSPSSVVVGTVMTCTAGVKGASPTGIITWASSGAGAFSLSSCTLSSGACSISYTPSATTTLITITASYGGDSSNARSSTTFSFTVNSLLSAGAIAPNYPTIGKGELIQLRANPSGGIPPYNVTWYAATGPGACSISDALVSTGPTYSPSPTVSTYYCYIATDSEDLPVSVTSSTDLVTVSNLPVPVLTVSCSHTSVVVGSAITCKVKIQGSGSTPTGYAAWSSSSPGNFQKAVCVLSRGACSVRFTPTAAGSPAVLAVNYGGDSENSPFAGTHSLAVTMKATRTTLSCKPSLVFAGWSTTIMCKVKVTGYLPTGEVSWSQSGMGSVSLSSTMCILTKGACSVTMTGATAGKVGLLATYSGNSNNQGSSRTTTLTIM